MPSIERIELARTRWQPKLTGSWPASWGNLTSLRWLDLSGSTGYTALITDPLPQAWFTAPGMSNLRAFICQDCKWVMAADASYSAWQQLAYLDISGNRLFALDNLGLPFTWLGNPTNVLPTEWEILSLSVLRARGCNLTAATSTELAIWTNMTQDTGLINRLRVLDIGDNPELSFTDMEMFFGQMRLWEL
uniref:Leucine-rich repeat-containing N-terminal plant-type domain-containing protein n=1 Tax=Tetradesmus obliquus TaxID=3088 RepID=A0A383W616_TETOB|eukprot:jgi/Sobl393_1/10724/SZX72582.1